MQTDHFVQTFRRQGKKLVASRPERCRDEIQAKKRGQKAAEYVAGVLVFSVTGEPEFNEYEPPVVLARYGEVPANLA